MSDQTTSTRLDPGSIVKRLDQGHESLAWQHQQSIRDLARIDLNTLVNAKDPRRAIQNTPVQQLFWAIKEQGIDQSGDAIRLLSDDQLIRMLDYDAWRHSELQPAQAITWLSAFEVTGDESLAKRYRRLDEEFQVAFLQGKIRTYDNEELDANDSARDRVFSMPCGEFHYEVLSDSSEYVQFVNRLIDSALDTDVGYAYGLLNYASHSIPNEAEYQLLQFREARMQEDGFVSYQESLENFKLINFESLKTKWSPSVPSRPGLISTTSGSTFLERVLSSELATGKHADLRNRVHDHMLYLANGLCGAVGIEAGDSRGLIKILEQERALVSLGLEFLAEGDVDLGFKIVVEEPAKTLFRIGITLVSMVQKKVIQKLGQFCDVSAIDELYRRRKLGALLLHLDTKMLDSLGFDLNEMLKGLFNRFPMRLASGGAATKPGRYQFRPFTGIQDLNEFNSELEQAIALLAKSKLN